MKLLTLCGAIVLIAGGVLYGNFEDDFHEKMLKIGWSRALSELDQYSVDQQRIILQKALRAFGSDIQPREAERQKNFEIAQAAMLAIPDHAKYYQDKLESTRELAKINEALPWEEQNRLRSEGKWVGLGDYSDLRCHAFPVLGLLPSPETVAVLGHFLEDPENRAPRNFMREDFMPYPPNCAAAYIAISNLGIEHPPVQGKIPELTDRQFAIADVDAWKDWWGEVKSGKRTYRFIGSSIEYGPNGPVTGEQLEIILKNRQRAAEPRKGSEGAEEMRGAASDGGEPSKTAWIAMILAGLAIITSLLWYFRKAA